MVANGCTVQTETHARWPECQVEACVSYGVMCHWMSLVKWVFTACLWASSFWINVFCLIACPKQMETHLTQTGCQCLGFRKSVRVWTRYKLDVVTLDFSTPYRVRCIHFYCYTDMKCIQSCGWFYCLLLCYKVQCPFLLLLLCFKEKRVNELLGNKVKIVSCVEVLYSVSCLFYLNF